MAASVASLLELPIESVPDFALMVDDEPNPRFPKFWLELQSFVKKYGYFFLEMRLTKNTPFMPLPYPALAIFMGDANNGGRHAVVGRVDDDKFIPIHDPFLHSGGLANIESVCFLVPLDCSKMTLIEPENIIRPGYHDTDSCT